MFRRTNVVAIIVSLVLIGLPAWLQGREAPNKPDKHQGLMPTELLPLASGVESFAVEINDGGSVAGTSRGAGGINTAVVWDRHGNAVALPPLAGDLESFGEGINNRGQVVGRSRSGTGPCAAFGEDTAVVWEQGGPRALQPLPGDTESRAFAISDTGDVVGTSLAPRLSDCSAAFTPVKWDRHGNVTELFNLLCEGSTDPFAEGVAQDVNNEGRVVGLGIDPTFGVCFPFVTGTIWDGKHSVESALIAPGGYFDTAANGVNNNGLVAGETFDFGFFGQPDRAVIWDKNGNPTTLPPLAGDSDSTGQAINDRGEVAGSSGTNLAGFFGPPEGTAVVWDTNGVATALDPLAGDTLSFGFGINSAGHVVGNSQSAVGGLHRAVVWR